MSFNSGVVAPEVSVAYRFGLTALVLFAWCGLRRIPLRFDVRTHASLALLGLRQYAANYVLLCMSEAYLTSGLVAVLFALVLVWSLVGARLFFDRPLPASVVAGAAVGMAGVTLVFWPEVSQLRAAGQAPGRRLGGGRDPRGFGRQLVVGARVRPRRARRPQHGMGDDVRVAGRGPVLRAPPCPVRVRRFAFVPRLARLPRAVRIGDRVHRISHVAAPYRGRSSELLGCVHSGAREATSTLVEGYRWSAFALSGMALVLAGNLMVLRGKGAMPAQGAGRALR